MPLQMKVWAVRGEHLHEIESSYLDYERRLEAWISADPAVAGIDLLVLGTQVSTGFGYIDLLGVTSEGEIVIIEIKCDRTPRDVVAQSLEYASWVDERVFDDFDQIAKKHRSKSLQELFSETFGVPVPNELNGTNHRIVIVSSELDRSSERIVKYLATKHDLNINAVFFKFFRQDGQEFLGRAWLMDPEEVEERSQSRRKAPWSGYWFVNVGEGEHRTWDDNVKYGFIGAGQGERFSQSLQKLSVGDKIFAYMKGLGYVGFGEVTSPAVPAKEFIPPNADKPLLQLPLRAPRASDNADDPAKSEWASAVRWVKTFPREQAKTFKGVFANQNIVCKLRDQQTLDFVTREFNVAVDGGVGY